MKPLAGLIRALDYIEEHLTDDIDLAAAAHEATLSLSQLQHVFSILCGCTPGEYIRKRRLTLAGAELAAGACRVIDAAFKYGYDSPESFARAFTRFHGVTPSQARRGAPMRVFSRLSVQLIMKGGQTMEYHIEEKDDLILTGYTRRFKGSPAGDERASQESQLYMHTRANQYLLRGLRCGFDEADYNVLSNVGSDGYDFSIAARLKDSVRSRLSEDTVLGESDAARFEEIVIPKHLYAIFRTKPCAFPTREHLPLRREILTQWLPSSGYVLSDAPEIQLIYWFPKPRQQERVIELWLPIERA